ncbi:MAG TPA: hypothetical protein DDX84_04345, partial [Nitrospiraceae bacterium]|nr:hypothetical protein [Nitrospiraceae bacterium]
WGTNYYNGKMDEVVLYNVALSQTEILNRFKELPAQLERADANDTSTLGYGFQAGDTIAIRFTNETNAPTTITKDNINTVLPVTGNETFTGDNGSAPNSSYWGVFGSGTANIQNDSLYVAGTITSDTGVSSQNKITLSGDFDIQVDFSNFAISSGGGALTFRVNAGSYVVQIERRGGTWGNYILSEENYGTYSNNNIASTVTSGSLRIKRSGSTFTTYYNVGSGWQGGWTYSGDTSNMYVQFFSRSDGGDGNPTGNFDNYTPLPPKTWLDGSGNIGSAVWTQTRFPNDTLLVTLSNTTSAPTVTIGDIITLSGGVIKEKTGTNSITGSTTIRGSYDLNGAVAYWNFNESSGNPSDSVGQYNTGTLNYSTTAPTYSTGKYNNAINFDGGTNSQYVSVSNYPDLNPTNTTVFPGLTPSNITVEAWVKSSASTWNASGTIVSKRNVYILYPVSGTKNMEFWVYAGSAWRTVTFTADSSFDITQWHHYVGTYDGTTVRIYVDGVEQGPGTSYSGTINTADTGNLFIGMDDGQAVYLNGSIDEVVVYNRAITADDVRKRASAKFKTAVAKDAQVTPQAGIQSGDKVIITFNAPTAGTIITSANINTALALSNGHSWKDGAGNIGSAVWSTSPGGYTNDTLTITLSTGTSVPTVAVGDTISLSGGVIKDAFGRSITESVTGYWVIGGNFGVNLPTGGIAYYNFDEQGGTTAYDSIGSNHGTLNNSFWRTERIFKGLYFDGSRYVDIPDSADFDLSSYTIDAYVKIPDGLTGGVRRIISQDDGTNYWKLQLNNNNLELCDSRLSTQCNSVNPVVTINDGEWHHLIAIRDDTNNQVLLYVDGVATTVSVACPVECTPHNIADTTSVQIGWKSDGTEYFIGMVDEIVVYNRALTLTEVHGRYRAPIKSAFTSDTLFNSGVQSGDKVIIRFHGKTNGYPSIATANIGTNLVLSSSHTWGTIQSAVWSTYNGITNNTLTITLGDRTGATLAGNDAITISGTSSIKDTFGKDISDSFVLSKDFDFNLPEDAAAYWKLNETSGTTAYDSFGTNNGTLYNSPAWTGGKFNNAISFDGIDDYIQNSSSFLNSVLSSFTMEAWVKTTSGGTIFTLGEETSNKGQSVIGISGGKVYGRIQQNNSTTGFGDIISTLTYNDNQWHHIALTYDGATKQGILYVDGAPVGTPLTTTSSLTLTTSYFRIGLGLGNAFNYFSGYIDDVALYSRALTAEEVLGRYGDYTVTARAYDTSGGGPNIQAGDTVTFKFSGPTNGAVLDTSSCPSGSACIDNALFLSNLHTWRDVSGAIGSAVWSNDGGNTNDTLTIVLSTTGGLPTVEPLDTVSIGLPIGAAYRAFSKSAKIGGLFGDNLPASGNKVAYWNFDEQGGTTAYDSIGSNHGTLNNSFWRTEQTFKGLYFDGGRYVDVPDSPDFNLSSYTIDAWVKVPDGLTTGIRSVIAQDDGVNYWRLRLNDNRLELCDSRLTTPCNNTGTTINDGEWHHLSVVRDDTANEVLFYIDGVNIYTATLLTETGTHAINANIQIGRKYNATEYFYGMIDEVVLYNRVLTDAEIQTRYRAPIKVAFTRDPYFNSGVQSGKDKIIIRFHGKTN